MLAYRYFFVIAILLALLPHSFAQLPSPEDAMTKRIAFWVKIYSELSTSQGVIHDAKYPEIVYETMDFTADQQNFTIPTKTRENLYQNKIKNLKAFYVKLLLSIHKKQHTPEALTDAEKRIVKLYSEVKEPNKFFAAAHGKRVRFQLGQKDRFYQGLYYSGKYLPAMEQIFKNKGLPVEITRLPFVESSFNVMARSKVGASGIWQFMRSTGKSYLKINEVIDERNDPLKATEAAAELLKLNYESLKSWPLAITAYNHGRKGMMRAQSKLGTDNLSEIIENYRSRSFGFASSNFYSEFMAAVEVEKNAEKYFGKIDRDHAMEFHEVVMNDYVDIQDLATYTRIPITQLLEYNPSFTDNIVKRKFFIPSEFSLKIPVTMRDLFLVRYNQIPPQKKFANQKGNLLGKTFRKIFR